MSLFRALTAHLGSTMLSLTCLLGPSQAALLVHQPPTLAAEDVRVGSEGQGALLAELFTFAGSGQELAWWGTETTGFRVQVFAVGDRSAPVLSTSSVAAESTAHTVSVGGVEMPVFRFSIGLSGLVGGSYTISVLETALDPQGLTWYWLLGSGGDGEHLSGFAEPFEERDFGGDLSLAVIGDRPTTGVPTPATLPLALAALMVTLLAGRLRRPARLHERLRTALSAAPAAAPPRPAVPH